MESLYAIPTPVAIDQGGTGQTSKAPAFDALGPGATLGDTIYHDGSDHVRLAGSTVAAKRFLTQTGNGAASAAPAWAAIADADLPATIVRTSRSISTTSPITGGGDLSADRTIAFDQTVALGNNARVAVSKNSGATTGTRRRINFIEGSNVTLTVTDDAGNEEVDVTIAASAGGGAVDGSGTASKLPKWSDADTLTDSIITEGAAGLTAVLSGNGARGITFDNADANTGAHTIMLCINDQDKGCYIGMSSSTYNQVAAWPANYGLLASSSDSDGLAILPGLGSKPGKIQTTSTFAITASNFTLAASTGHITTKDGSSVINCNLYTANNGGTPMVFTAGSNNTFSFVTGSQRTTIGTNLTQVAGDIVCSAGNITVPAGKELITNGISVIATGNTLNVHTPSGKSTWNGMLEPLTDNAVPLGSASKRWTTLYSVALNTGDVHMDDEEKNSHISIREAQLDDEDPSGLYLIDRRNGDRFRLLTEKMKPITMKMVADMLEVGDAGYPTLGAA